MPLPALVLLYGSRSRKLLDALVIILWAATNKLIILATRITVQVFRTPPETADILLTKFSAREFAVFSSVVSVSTISGLVPVLVLGVLVSVSVLLTSTTSVSVSVFLLPFSSGSVSFL